MNTKKVLILLLLWCSAISLSFAGRLHEAVKNGQKAIVQMLLRKKTTKVNAKDEHGKTPLHYAVENRQIEIIRVLLNAGAWNDIKATPCWRLVKSSNNFTLSKNASYKFSNREKQAKKTYFSTYLQTNSTKKGKYVLRSKTSGVGTSTMTTLSVYDTEQNKNITHFQIKCFCPFTKISESGNYLVIDDRKEIAIYEVLSGKKVTTLEGYTIYQARTKIITFSPDNSFIVTTKDNEVALWTLKGECIALIDDVGSPVSFVPENGKICAYYYSVKRQQKKVKINIHVSFKESFFTVGRSKKCLSYSRKEDNRKEAWIRKFSHRSEGSQSFFCEKAEVYTLAYPSPSDQHRPYALMQKLGDKYILQDYDDRGKLYCMVTERREGYEKKHYYKDGYWKYSEYEVYDYESILAFDYETPLELAKRMGDQQIRNLLAPQLKKNLVPQKPQLTDPTQIQTTTTYKKQFLEKPPSTKKVPEPKSTQQEKKPANNNLNTTTKAQATTTTTEKTSKKRGKVFSFMLIPQNPLYNIYKSALFGAILGGDYATVEQCLNSGLPVTVVDSFGFSALHRAVEKGNTKIIELLLRCKAPVNLPILTKGTYQGCTPLHIAAITKHPNDSIIKILLKAEADVLAVNGAKKTPYELAEICKNKIAMNALYQVSQKKMVEKKTSEKKAPNCSICLQLLHSKAQAVALPCGHVFHLECTQKLVKKKECPKCRGNVTTWTKLYI